MKMNIKYEKDNKEKNYNISLKFNTDNKDFILNEIVKLKVDMNKLKDEN